MRARGEPDVTYATLLRDLKGLNVPTLLVWGEGDRILPLPLLEEWRAGCLMRIAWSLQVGGICCWMNFRRRGKRR